MFLIFANIIIMLERRNVNHAGTAEREYNGRTELENLFPLVQIYKFL